MPVDLIVTPPPSILLRVQPMPRIVIIVGTGGGGGGAGTITEIQNAGGLVVTAGTGPIVQVAADFGSAAGKVTEGNDSRLSNARTPTAHKTSHQLGGTDEISVAGLTGLLATAQTPAAHKTTHATGGTDALVPSDIGAVPTSRAVATGTGLLGGGNLTADRTLTPDFGAAAGKVMEGNQAPSGGQLGGTTLIAADVRGLRETAGPTLLTLGAVADGQVLVRSGSTVIGADILNEYWCRDSSISYGSKTDEFTAGSLGANWSRKIWSSWAALTTNDGAVDSTATLTSGHYRQTVNARRSWFMFQPGDDTALFQPFTYVGASGFQFRMRFTPPLFGDVSSGAASSSGVPGRIYITKDSSGNPDVANNVFCGYGISAGALQIVAGNVTGGGGTTNATYTAERNLDCEFIFRGAGNAGTITVDMFLRTPTGTRLLRSEALGASNGATLYFALRMNPLNNASNIFAVDYFREYPDLKITP